MTNYYKQSLEGGTALNKHIFLEGWTYSLISRLT